MSVRELWVAGTDVVWLLWKGGSSCQCFAANTSVQGSTDGEVSRDEKANLRFPSLIFKAGG